MSLFKRGMVLLIVPFIFGFSLPGAHSGKKFENDYLDFICGKWTETAVLKNPNGKIMAKASTTWECVQDKENACYRMTGEVRVADGEPVSFNVEYRRTSATEASTVSRYSDGRTGHGTLKQTESDEVLREGFNADGSLSMRAVTTFDGSTMNTHATYFNADGQVRMIAETVATRHIP